MPYQLSPARVIRGPTRQLTRDLSLIAIARPPARPPVVLGTAINPCFGQLTPVPQVQVADISAKTCMFSLLGPQADQIMQQLQAGAIVGAPHGTHTLLSLGGGQPQLARVLLFLIKNRGTAPRTHLTRLG